MTLEALITQYILVRRNKPTNSNELLDYIQQCYIRDEISIVHYRDMYRELSKRGANKPNYFHELVNSVVGN